MFLLVYFRFSSTSYWNSDIKENCVLSTDAFTRIGSTETNMIVNDKDWDLYLYDQTNERCRNSINRSPAMKGNCSNNIS